MLPEGDKNKDIVHPALDRPPSSEPVAAAFEWNPASQNQTNAAYGREPTGLRSNPVQAFVPIYSIGEMVSETLAQSDLCD